jgi:peptidoglycan hydrolase-like protein with peptidoglycan-binding domain
VALVLAVAVVAALGLGGVQPSRPADASDLPPGTAQVTRATLTQTERIDGTLTYGTPATMLARVSTGTLTWLPPVGTVVKPGRAVFKVDDLPVVLIVGATPPYRALANATKGADVLTLEKNLRAFGYTGFNVDEVYTSATASAVKRWQRDLGRVETGTVDVGQIVVAPGAIRVAEHKAVAGSPAGGEVLAYTGTTRVVTVPLEVTRQHLVHVGLSALVTLPDGETVTGTVAAVGTVAKAAQQGQPAAATVDVTVTIADQSTLGTLDGAPVGLSLVVAERADVLTVPVGALIALREGGYGVQVVEGSSTRYVAVQAGMFAAGKVEISGTGIVEGLVVGVPG